MAETAIQAAEMAPIEDFAALLDESFAQQTSIEGSVVRGIVVSIENDHALIDVGLKSEGRVPVKEFGLPGQDHGLSIGDAVEVYVERMEDRDGMSVLSREKARREGRAFRRKTLAFRSPGMCPHWRIRTGVAKP